MKQLFFTLILLININSFAQKKTAAEVFVETAKTKFDKDLKNGNLKLYFIGGIAPMMKDNDYEFQKKYTIYFYDFGCLPPPNFDLYNDYNKLVYQYLTIIHKDSWETLFRKDALGYSQWKKYNK
jgi:hypothetical protein